MDAWMWVVIGVLVIGVVFAVVSGFLGRARRERLRSTFGPEYDRTVHGARSRHDAEGDLRQRLKRHRELELRPLSPEVAAGYAEQWFAIQARFVDEPEDACNRGEELLERVLRDRGYPVDEDFDSQADLVSVDHPQLVGSYRQARDALHGAPADGNGRVDELRRVFRIYRDLFSDLLDHAPDGASQASEATPREARPPEAASVEQGQTARSSAPMPGRDASPDVAPPERRAS
jgi:hypothetical protein